MTRYGFNLLWGYGWAEGRAPQPPGSVWKT